MTINPKKMQKENSLNRLYNINFLILKLYSLNKSSINSILKRFSSLYFINLKFINGCPHLIIKLANYMFIFEAGKIVNYFKKENIYFNILGIKTKNNFLNYDFFNYNFGYFQKVDFKFLVFKMYFIIAIWYNLFIKLYFIFSFLFMSNFNFLIFQCLHLNKQLLG